MATIEKRTRYSRDGAVEYQLEFKEKSAGNLSEYRVRHGVKGTWTKWYRTQSIPKLLDSLGFNTSAPTWSNDFCFESYFGRGEIQINRQMFKVIAGTAGYHPVNTHLYSRLKRVTDDLWIVPASALETRRIYEHLRDLIKINS